MSRLWLQIAIAAIFVLAWTQSNALETGRASGVLPIDPPTPYIHYTGSDPPTSRVLVIHGLDTSKATMQLLSAALADGGFEVYAIDLPGHGDSPVGFRTDLAQQAIRNARASLGENTIVLGHSLGAGLLLDMASTEQFSTLVLLAPPPISIAGIRADRVLIVTGEFDVPLIRRFMPIASDVAGSNVESWRLPWGAHSAAIFNPQHIGRIVDWLGGDGQRAKTWRRVFWIAAMLLSSVWFGVAQLRGGKIAGTDRSVLNTVVGYVVGCGVAMLVLKVVHPLGWLRLFATDYLVAFLLVTGLFVWLVVNKARKTPGRSRGLATAVIAAAFVIGGPGLFAISHVLHMSLSGGRWWRFFCIAAAGLPLFLSDESTIRLIYPRWKSSAVALLTRVLFLAFITTGALTLNRENGFLVMITPLLVVFWMVLWFAAGVVHRRTQSPLAAALFAALVQGWAFAAWFVTI